MKKVSLFILIFLSLNIYSKTKRVVSLAPNITDILCYLGYEDNIVAVDRFSKKTKNSVVIGDLMSINYEKLINIKPDIIFLTKEQKSISKKIKKIKNIPIHIVDIKKLTDFNYEINSISKALNIKNKEILLAATISISKIINKQKDVLIIIDRSKKSLNNIFVSGNDNFINDFLPILNLKNIVKSKSYPKIGIERIISLNPSVIIDLTYNADIGVWSKYKQINAVKNNKVYKADIKLTIPSPDIIDYIIELKNKLWN